LHPEPFDASKDEDGRPNSDAGEATQAAVPGAAARPSRPFLRIAHRGAAGLAPENTLGGIEKALSYSVDMVEIDVRPCADGTLVVFHDDELKRVTGRPGRVSTSTLADLRAIDLGGGERIPTLEETLALLRGRAQVNLDQKRDNLASELLDAIDRAGAREETMLSGNARRTFHAFRELAPSVSIAVSIDAPWLTYLVAHVSPSGARAEADRMIAKAQAAAADQVTLAYRLASPRVVKRLHQAGLPVLTWTVDSLRAMRALRRAGVDGITSNRPDLLATLV
jgi:glycerophosphoryl diester phosphodiesterase